MECRTVMIDGLSLSSCLVHRAFDIMFLRLFNVWLAHLLHYYVACILSGQGGSVIRLATNSMRLFYGFGLASCLMCTLVT